MSTGFHQIEVGYFDGDEMDPEVGRRRLLGRRGRRVLAGLFGGPAAARAVRRRQKRRRAPSGAGGQMKMKAPLLQPVTQGPNLLATGQRRQVVGGSVVAPAAGGNVGLVINVNRPFQGERLVIAVSEQPESVTLETFQIGDRSQFAGQAGGLPVIGFQADTVGALFLQSVAYPGLPLVFGFNAATFANDRTIAVLVYGQTTN